MTEQFDGIQKYGKEQFEVVTATTNSIVKAIQQIASESADYSKKSIESSSAFMEKLLGAKSYDSAIQLQSEYWKSSYAGFIAQATKMSELYFALVKEAFKPIEGVFAKVSGDKY